MHRRTFLKIVSTAAATALVSTPHHVFAGPQASPLPALADANEGEFFVFIHAAGGWDVTLSLDPRNEKKGLVAPASTDNTDPAPIRRWVDAPLDEGVKTFALVRPPGSNLAFGPGIGDLAAHADRLTVVNGLAMNTVSHPDGSAFSATGRHLQGGRAPGPSIDTALGSELGASQLFPVVSVQFPSAYVGENLDRRAVPLAIGQIGALSRSLSRAEVFDDDPDRDAVTALLAQEANDLAARATYPDVLRGMALQYDSLRRMLGSRLQDVFSAEGLKKAYPAFNYKARFQANGAVNAAFAVEAMKRNVVRCVSFALGGFDTHGQNYKQQALVQQEAFDVVAALLQALDATPHPTFAGKKLSDHAHILVISDFCRTPQINLAGGRDHYPNNSALVVSPRFRANFAFGKSDVEQLLPAPAKAFSDGTRAIAPPDLLATFVSAFGVAPRKYMRDGEMVRELLRA
jgi:uncharacterized protein (DUF1501 family)